MIEVRPISDEVPPAAPPDAVAPASPAAPRAGRALVAHNISLLSLGQLVTWAGTLVWTVIVPRRLGSSEIGILTLGTAVSGVLGVVVGLGLPPLLVREIAADPRRAPRLIGTAIVLRGLLLAPALAGTLLLAFLGPFRGEEAAALILGWGLCLTTVISSPVAAGLQALEKMNYLAYGAVLGGTLGTVSSIVMVMLGIRAVGLLISNVVIGVLFTLVFLFWARPLFRIDWRVTWADLRQLLSDSLPYWGFAAFFTIYLWIDSLMLAFMASSTVLGWYGLPTRLFSTLMAVPVILSNATLPRLVRAHKESDQILLRTARPVMELVVLLAMPICTGAVLIASPLLRAIYGPGFAGSIPVFALLALCIPPMYLNIMANQIMIARKQQVVWTKVMVLASIINPLLNLFLIPYFQRTQGNGAIGASIAMVITELVLAAIGLRLVRGAFVRNSAVRMLKGAVATAAMGIVVALALHVDLVLAVASGMATFAAVALLLRIPTHDELEQGHLLLRTMARRFGFASAAPPERRTDRSRHATMIPRTFHHIWPGYDEIPPSVMRMRDSWVSHHPDWEFRLWRPADLGWLRHQALFERAESYAQKADIARFEVIERYGGVYLDTDMECLRPIDPLLEGLDFFAGREPHGPVCASIFGAVPGFRLLRDVIASLPVSCLVHRRLNVQTGPALLTDVVDRGEWERRPTVRIFAAPFFYPYDWSEPWRRGTRFPTAFAVHHWSHSWKDQDGVRPLISELRPTTLSAAATEVSALIAAGRAGLRHKARASIVTPLKRAARRYVERAISTQPRAVPLGDGTILVSGPLNIRLLCPAGDLSLTPELALDGTYGPDFVEFLRRALRPGMTVVDVGANLGIYTLVAARLGCRVHAYECNPEMVDLLERNVAMNWLDDRVVVVRKAAGRLDEPIRFHAPREMRGLGSTAQPLEGRTSRPQSSEITVESERLDVGLAKLGFIDLLKIDVEGGETDVLAGAASLLAERRVGMIALEYRLDAVDDLHRTEMEVRLRWLAEGLGARFHLPSRPSPLRLDEVLATAQYPNLLVRFPWSSISLTPSGRD